MMKMIPIVVAKSRRWRGNMATIIIVGQQMVMVACCLFCLINAVPSVNGFIFLPQQQQYFHQLGQVLYDHNTRFLPKTAAATISTSIVLATSSSADNSNNNNNDEDEEEEEQGKDIEDNDDIMSIWNLQQSNSYMTNIYTMNPTLQDYLQTLRSIHRSTDNDTNEIEIEIDNTGIDSEDEDDEDPLWEQVKYEALEALQMNPEAGPQLYTGILSQTSLMEAIVTVISHEIATELIPATEIKNLFLEQLTNQQDKIAISFDLLAAATRSASVENMLSALLFQQGFHALVCYRLGHRLWYANRGFLAYYMQSTVSRKYSADIHPAAKMGIGIHLRAGAGIVIGETAVVGDDSSILPGVTLGGTGKEAGDRHPKVGKGVLIEDGASILGNIPIGDGAIITSKSIVTKPVPPLAIVSGVPAILDSFRTLTMEEFDNDLQSHLVPKYLHEWQQLLLETTTTSSTTNDQLSA